MVKTLPTNAGDLGSIPGLGRHPRRREGQPTPVFLPWAFHGQWSLLGYSSWGHKESDTTEWLTLSVSVKHTHTHTPFSAVTTVLPKCMPIASLINESPCLQVSSPLIHHPLRTLQYVPGDGHCTIHWACLDFSSCVCVYLVLGSFIPCEDL